MTKTKEIRGGFKDDSPQSSGRRTVDLKLEALNKPNSPKLKLLVHLVKDVYVYQEKLVTIQPHSNKESHCPPDVGLT